MRLWTVLLSVSLALGALGISEGGVVHASTLTVCASGCSSTTINGAVQAATKGDTISIAPGTYHENVTLQGSTSGPVVIDGGGSHTTVTVNSGITAVLADLTVTDGGSNNGPGGGIENLGYLTVNRDAIVNNRVTSGYDTRYGGGIANDTNGQLTVINSTIAGNQAVDGGGLWSNGGGDFVFITNSTIAGNVATYDGGGIGAPANTVYVQNTIVADNQQTNGSHFDTDCNTVLKSNGNNLLGSTNGCSLAGGSNDQQTLIPSLVHCRTTADRASAWLPRPSVR